MKYFIVHDKSEPKAILLHDYEHSLLMFNSSSSYLTAAIDCCLVSLRGSILYKDDSSVKVLSFDEGNPAFSDRLIKKLTESSFWKIKETGELVDIAEFYNLSKNHLNL